MPSQVKYKLHETIKVATFCAEPVNPTVQRFGMSCVASSYLNSYWGTEHGGIVLSCPLNTKATDARSFALPWIFAEVWVPLSDDKESDHRMAAPWETGELVITQPYPYLARTLWGDNAGFGSENWMGDIEQFRRTYFARFAGGAFCQGDVALRGAEQQFYLTGRSDDVMNINGIRVATGEIESAILKDRVRPDSPIANVAVVGAAHPISGEQVVAFVTLAHGSELNLDTKRRLSRHVLEDVGSHCAALDFLVIPSIPETLTGKYMRRILGSILHETDPGDSLSASP